MEILKAAEECFLDGGDGLLDFTLDGEASSYYSSSSSTSFTAAAACGDESLSGSFAEFVEEELEWLSSKYEFPAVETCFGILSDNPELMSVLENSSDDNSNNNNNGNFKVPVRPRSKGRRRRREPSYGELPYQAMWTSQVAVGSKLDSSTTDGRMGRRCLHCQSDKTPQWRAGPMGPKTLCNACGVRYKSGRLLPEYRPANSPTFSSEFHSNSHRRVVEMRRSSMGGGYHG